MNNSCFLFASFLVVYIMLFFALLICILFSLNSPFLFLKNTLIPLFFQGSVTFFIFLTPFSRNSQQVHLLDFFAVLVTFLDNGSSPKFQFKLWCLFSANFVMVCYCSIFADILSYKINHYFSISTTNGTGLVC